jgi:hypothetical protein
MHDLLVLLSTFGGLAMFGLVGFIIGPIVAALFLTVWDLYGAAFREILPAEGAAAEPDEPTATGPDEPIATGPDEKVATGPDEKIATGAHDLGTRHR